MNKVITIIEDDNDIRSGLEELLAGEGYDVLAYANGREALEGLSAVAGLPHLILLDLMMPVMTGYQFREVQLADERLNQIPVVVMSADGQAEKKLLQLPVTAFLRKPFDLDALLGAVSRHAR